MKKELGYILHNSVKSESWFYLTIPFLNSLLKKKKSSSFYAPNIANTTQFCMWLFNVKWRTNAHYLALVSFVNTTHYLVEQYFAFSLQSKMLKIPLHIWLQFTIGAYLKSTYTYTKYLFLIQVSPTMRCITCPAAFP